MDRRHFLRSAAFVTGAMAIEGFPYHLYADTTRKNISDRIILGNTGIEVSRMAIGTGTNGWAGSSDQTRRFGIKGLADLFQAGIDHGVFFWDSADQYGSHPHMREALKGLERARQIILSGKYQVVVLDELISALELDLIEERDILDLISIKPEMLHLVMTGHNKYKNIIKTCDLVTEMKIVKHPYYENILAQRGIDY
jgi:diketogulonate reductase-like aldo/keto reductase